MLHSVHAVFRTPTKEPRRTRDRTLLRRRKQGQLSAQGTVGCRPAGMPHYCAAVNCYNSSNKVRLSLFRFPKEADRYTNVDVEIQDISKKYSNKIRMLLVLPT
jgi:hypothetical protein